MTADGDGDALVNVNVYIEHTDGSTTDHLNVSPNQVPSLLAAIDWTGVQAYKVARVRQPRGLGD